LKPDFNDINGASLTAFLRSDEECTWQAQAEMLIETGCIFTWTFGVSALWRAAFFPSFLIFFPV
jgi:hypothetical protein